MGKKITLSESDLREMVENSVKKVLNEISYNMSRNAFKALGKKFDENPNLYNDPKKKRQLSTIHQGMVDRSAENFDPNMDVLVCFDDHSQMFKAGDLKQYFEITGFLDPSPNPIYADQKIVGYPRLKGFAGPMWDGDKVRYESWKVYDRLSM